jgi:hypothetical protein
LVFSSEMLGRKKLNTAETLLITCPSMATNEFTPADLIIEGAKLNISGHGTEIRVKSVGTEPSLDVLAPCVDDLEIVGVVSEHEGVRYVNVANNRFPGIIYQCCKVKAWARPTGPGTNDWRRTTAINSTAVIKAFQTAVGDHVAMRLVEVTYEGGGIRYLCEFQEVHTGRLAEYLTDMAARGIRIITMHTSCVPIPIYTRKEIAQIPHLWDYYEGGKMPL